MAKCITSLSEIENDALFYGWVKTVSYNIGYEKFTVHVIVCDSGDDLTTGYLVQIVLAAVYTRTIF